MNYATKNPIFGVYDQVRLKQACSATESRYNLEIVGLSSVCIILSSLLPFRLLLFRLWFVPLRLLQFLLLPFRLLWKFWLFPFRLLIIADKETFFFFFLMFLMIIIHIQKYNVTTQGIKLSKMRLFYEVKNLNIYVTLKWKK